MQMAAHEVAHYEIRVVAVCPDSIETGIPENTERREVEAAKVPAEHPASKIPLTGDKATAEDVAERVLFLVPDRARRITGSPGWIDRGQSVIV